jgi:hypothetical protein
VSCIIVASWSAFLNLGLFYSVYEKFELNLGNGQWGVVRTGVVALAGNLYFYQLPAVLPVCLSESHHVMSCHVISYSSINSIG